MSTPNGSASESSGVYIDVQVARVEGAEIEGHALRLFVRRGPFGLLRRRTRSFHPPNDSWHHVELHRDRTAVVVLKVAPLAGTDG